MCLQGALDCELRSQLPDGQERGVENPTRLVGFLALVAELGLDVVPPTKLFAVLPAGRQRRDGASVHEAGDAFEVCLLRSGFRHVFEVFPLGHLDLHEPCPAFRVGDHRATVTVAVDGLELLPAGFVCELDARSVDQLGLDDFAMSLGFRLVLRLPFLALAFVLVRDTSVARLVRRREFGFRIGSDVALDVARLGTLLVTEDEVGLGIAVHQYCNAVELLLRREVALLGEPDHLLDGVDDEAVVDIRLLDFHVYSPVFGL